jgi:hypothetical protein
MATEKQKKAAAQVFDTVIRHLDGNGLKYEVREAQGDDLMIHLTMRGDDLPISLYIIVDADRELLMIKSPEFSNFGEEQISDAAKAVCAINYAIADGSYALDVEDGSIMWTITATFRGSLLGDEAIHYLIGVSVTTLDRFNDMFLMLKMGALDLDTFLAKIRN